MRYSPRIDDDRPIVSASFPGATSVAVIVRDLVNGVNLTAPAVALNPIGDLWTFDLGGVTGLIGGATMEDVIFAQLAVVMTPTGGTGVEVVIEVPINGSAASAGLASIYNGFIYVSPDGAPGAIRGFNGTPDNPVDNFLDMIDLIEQTGIRNVRIGGVPTGPFEIEDDIENIHFFGNGQLFINVKIGDTKSPVLCLDCSFNDLTIAEDSAFGGFEVPMRRCNFSLTTGLTTFFGILLSTDCKLFGVLTFGDTDGKPAGILGSIEGFDFSDVAGPGPATLDFGGFPTLAFMKDTRGDIVFDNLIGLPGDNFLQVGCIEGARLSFTDTCTGGAAKVDGHGSIAFDESADTFSLKRRGLYDQPNQLTQQHIALDADVPANNLVRINAESGAGALVGMRVRVTDGGILGTPTEEAEIIGDVLVESATHSWHDLTFQPPLSFVPALGDLVLIRPSPDESLLENAVLDQRVYQPDGPNQLQVSARLSRFINGADAAAAVKDTSAGPGVPHARAIKTIRVTSDIVPEAAGQPDAHRQVKE